LVQSDQGPAQVVRLGIRALHPLAGASLFPHHQVIGIAA
jgi:hypothetical protein